MRSLSPKSDAGRLKGLIARSTWAKDHVHGKVLVCGCGSGYETEFYGESADSLIGVDLDLDALKHAKEKYSAFTFIYHDIKDLPFLTEEFDVVVSFEILEHFHPSEVLTVLKEVKRVLKPGGQFIGSTPRMKDHTRHYPELKEGDHCVLYAEMELKKILSIFEDIELIRDHEDVEWAWLFKCKKRLPEKPCNIDVVLLSCHRVAKTLKCINSLEKRYPNYHLWLIENGSPAHIQYEVLRLKEQKKFASMIFLEENLYCGGGRNFALQYCQREFIAWFDNDMTFEPKCLIFLQKILSENPKIGAICAQVRKDGLVQLNGREILGGRVDYSRDNLPIDDPVAHEEFTPDMIHGGATMFRRKALMECEHDNHYRFACDDLDMIMQIKDNGWELRNCPKAIVHHFPDEKGIDDYSNMRRNKILIDEDRAYFSKKWGITL